MKMFGGVLLAVCSLGGCEKAVKYPEISPMSPEVAKRCDYLAIGARAIEAQVPGYKAAHVEERLVVEPRKDKVDVYYQLPNFSVGGSGHAIIDPMDCTVVKVFFDE